MTNAQIIIEAMILAELDPMEIEVDTFAGWKRRGFSVKKGEKAVFKTKIWKPCKFKPEELGEGVEVPKDEEQTVNKKKLVLVNASFFTDEQVERRAK